MESSKRRGNEIAVPARRRDRELLEAAVRVFHRDGYANATVQHLADEMGILKGSVYHYMDAKEDLLYRIVDELHAEVEAILQSAVSAEDLDPLRRLELFVRQIVSFNLSNLSRVAIFYRDADRLSKERSDSIRARERSLAAVITGLIEQAQAEGLADASVDAGMLSNFLFGAVIWTYRWFRPDGAFAHDDVANGCAAFVRQGVVGNVSAPPPASSLRTARDRESRTRAADLST